MDQFDLTSGPSKSSIRFEIQPVHLLSTTTGDKSVLNITALLWIPGLLACIATTSVKAIREWIPLLLFGVCIRVAIVWVVHILSLPFWVWFHFFMEVPITSAFIVNQSFIVSSHIDSLPLFPLGLQE
jgi:hypothetical protein